MTTNSTLIRKAGASSVVELAQNILALDVSELHVQVLSEDPDEAFTQARKLAALDARVRVKIPFSTADGVPRLALVRRCIDAGININVTACTAFGQAVTVAAVGARYVSVLWCRTRDAHEDPAHLLSGLAAARDRGGSTTRILVGSIREPQDVTAAVNAGADAVCIPPEILAAWIHAPKTAETAAQFAADAACIQL